MDATEDARQVLLSSLSEEEAQEAQTLSASAIQEALDKGSEERRATETASHPLPMTSRILFR